MADIKQSAPVASKAAPVAPKAAPTASSVKKKLIVPPGNTTISITATGTPVNASNNHHMMYMTTCLDRVAFF